VKNIHKNNEPASLIEHRCSAHADYDNYGDKQALRECLITEQGCLCAYCMQRISPEVGKMKIEHWQCQSNHPDKQLNYKNLLGVCLGGEGFSPHDQHCDTCKGDRDFCVNPANPGQDIEQQIKFLGNGKIKSDNEVLDSELNDVLKLNHPQLVSNRKAVLESFTKTLSPGALGRRALQRQISTWTTPANEMLEPYCMVVVYWLRKKLVRA